MLKKRFADLHVHSNYSDSTFSPAEVVEAASRENLSCIGLTDHDCVDGIPLAVSQGEISNIEVIPGIEMTVEHKGYEVHILGYFIDWERSWLKTKLKEIQKSRVERMHMMIGLLDKEGIHVNADDVLELSGRGSVGRLHLAIAMVNTGEVKNLREAFKKYIGHLKSCYVTHIRISPEEAIDIITQCGGVPVWAHPQIMGRDDFLEDLIDFGIRGIEVYHTSHNRAAENKYLKIAEERDLLVTGGSDCHGTGKGDPLIGSKRIDYSLVERLKEKSQAH